MAPPPRSIADATRFTPTGPHAFTRTPMPAAATATVGETHQQRAARLRETARRAKLDQVSTVDKIIARGRVWADKAHRVAATSLICATVLCGGFTIFASFDMIMYARKKKRAYLEEQKALETADDAATSNNESVALAAVAAPTSTTTTPGSESNTVADKLKTWALSGLTPAEKEEELRRHSMESHVVVKDDILSRPGANDHAKGGNTGVLSSITSWWSGR